MYTLYPCPLSCYVIAANALVCLHVNYEEEGDRARLSLDVISTKEKTLWHLSVVRHKQKGTSVHFAKARDPIRRSQKKIETRKGLSL